MPEAAIIEQPMAETHEPEHVAEMLDQLLQGHLPAFVIRAAGAEVVPVNARELPAPVAHLEQLMQQNHDPSYVINNRLAAHDVEGPYVGPWHTDGSIDEQTRPFANYTHEGQTVVRMANRGPEYQPGKYVPEHEERQRTLSDQGKTDPDHMSPEVHVATLNPGDTVVLREGEDATFHQFETPQDAIRTTQAYSHRPPRPVAESVGQD